VDGENVDAISGQARGWKPVDCCEASVVESLINSREELYLNSASSQDAVLMIAVAVEGNRKDNNFSHVLLFPCLLNHQKWLQCREQNSVF
jgi:hypothetical protein